MADLITTSDFGPQAPGTYLTTSQLINASTGGVLATRNRTIVSAGTNVLRQSALWRRRYRRYCHWLERQYVNYTTGSGVFALPLSPALSTAEVAALTAVRSALSTIGYVPGAPAGTLPITPP